MWWLGLLAATFFLLTVILVYRYYGILKQQEKIQQTVGNLHNLEERVQDAYERLAQLKDTVNDWELRTNEARRTFSETLEAQSKLNQEMDELKVRASSAQLDLANARATADALRAGFDEKNALLMQNHQAKIDALRQSYMTEEENLKKQFEESRTMKVEEFEKLMTELTSERDLVMGAIEEQKTLLKIALEQNRLDRLDDERSMLKVPETDRLEIKELMDVCRHLRVKVPVCKAIYEMYYRTPLGTLINDIGARGVCGIYKITNVVDGKMYIGQSVDIGERWRQHIKRGCGADVGTISGSKLYGSMMDEGLWNFKFEIVQECGKDELTKFEKYWISYWNSVEYGYNMKAGG